MCVCACVRACVRVCACARVRVNDVRLVDGAEGLEVDLLLGEAEGAPRLHRVDGHHPQDADVVPLEAVAVVDDVQVDGVEGDGDGEGHEEGGDAPSYDVLGLSEVDKLPSAYSYASYYAKVCDNDQRSRRLLPPFSENVLFI